MNRPLALTLPALLGLIACTSTSRSHAPVTALVARAPVGAEYHAVVTDAGRLAEAVEPFTPPDEEGAPDGTPIEIGCRMLTIDGETAARVFGHVPPGTFAMLVDRDAAETTLAELLSHESVELLHAPSIALRAGQQGWISLTNEMAYLADFEILVDEGAAIADPRIGVVEEGLIMAARGRVLLREETGRDQPGIDLDLTLVLADLQRPFPELAVSLPVSPTPVSVQRPIASQQRLQTRTCITADDCLTLGVLSTGDPDRYLYAFVTAEVLTEQELEGFGQVLDAPEATPNDPH
jgi:hypothetical protein